MFERKWRFQHFGIAVEDELEMLIDLRNAEEESPIFSVKEVYHYGIERDTNNIDVFKFWRSLTDGV